GVLVAEAALRDTELAQRTQIQLATAAVRSAKAAVIQAELNFGYTNVVAPISGIIGKIQVDRGNLVGKSEPTLLATV
ncbi:efflux transporter periplasmic adaptor subunit, partial [Vibrio parahaemolyticus]